MSQDVLGGCGVKAHCGIPSGCVVCWGGMGGVCSVVCRKQLPLVLPVLDRFPLHLLFASSFSPTFHRCCDCLSLSLIATSFSIFKTISLLLLCIERELFKNSQNGYKLEIHIGEHTFSLHFSRFISG